MNIERVYLDLDRTLFDTDRFTQAVFQAVAALYAIPPEQLHAEIDQYYMYHGQLRYYDFFAHMTALGHDSRTVESDLRGMLAGGDFLYPDAHSLITFLAGTRTEPIIISFGPADYQHFKYSLLTSLQHIPFVAILDNKADYLAVQSPRPSLLVDDKLVGPLPEWCVQYVIDRKLAHEAQETHNIWRINSLRSVETALSVGYNEPNEKGTPDEAD